MLGISNIVKFDFPSPPPAESLSRSLELLFALGAIDTNCELTENIGEKISELPLHPFLGMSHYDPYRKYNSLFSQNVTCLN